VIVFVVSFILVIKLGTTEVVTESFVMTWAHVVVGVHILEANSPTENHYKVFLNGRDR